MHKNISKLYVLNFLAGVVFWYPIEKLFMQHIGISAFGVSVNAIVFLLVMVIFDVPAGVLADKWKRRYVLLLAFLCLLIASVTGGFSSNLAEYLPMNIMLGGFVALTQGTFQAIMYDSLRDTGRQRSYDKHQGWSYALFLSGLGVSSMIGGYMANAYGFRATYFVTAAVMVLGCVVTLMLVEPHSRKIIADRKLKEHIRASLMKIFASRLLMQLALLITAASILRSAQNEYSGLLFIALGLGVIPMGFANAGKWLASSFGQIVAPKIGRRALKLAPVFFVIFTVFSLLQTPWSLVFFYTAGFLFSVISNQAEAAVQDNTPSEIRATVLSVFSFASNVILVPIGLLFGWIAQRSNVFNSYLMIAIIGLLYLASWFFAGRSVLRQIYHMPAHATQLPSTEAEII